MEGALRMPMAPTYSFRHIRAVGEIRFRLMAACAGEGVIFRKPSVVEESAPKSDGVGGGRIVCRDGNRGKSERRREFRLRVRWAFRDGRFAAGAEEAKSGDCHDRKPVGGSGGQWAVGFCNPE